MIGALDAALAGLVRSALGDPDVDVVFATPATDWAARRGGPAINLYLHSMSAVHEGRVAGQTEVYGAEGFVSTRRPPDLPFRFRYLLTAWAARAEDEHELLGVLLGALLARESLLGELGPTIAGTPDLFVADPEDEPAGELWGALGVPPRPYLCLGVLARLRVRAEVPAGPPVRETPRLRTAGELRTLPRRGAVEEVPPPAVVANETVVGGDSEEPGRHFRIGMLPDGSG